MTLFDDPRNLIHQIILCEDTSSGFADSREAGLIGVTLYGVFDDTRATNHVRDIDWNNAVRGKIITNIRRAVVNRQTPGEETVSDFFGPVTGLDMVLYGLSLIHI